MIETKNPENISPPENISSIKPSQEVVVDKLKQPEGEKGGQQGLEPTRYGDWEKNGRCTDF
ncbi:MAG: DUF1674 domain-containing protein [Alphaproteobacteria bacterium]